LIGACRKPKFGEACRQAASLQAQCGKVVIAVSEDIDPNNADAIFWSIAYRSNISTDVHVTPLSVRVVMAQSQGAAGPMQPL
jgi:UbiD family decarboxylase